MSDPFVQIDGVDLRYGGPGGVLAVSGLTLAVNKGEFAAVVGPSGCGKSTLMRLVTGLHLPQSGTVRVGGQLVTKPVSIAGMAFQNPTMLPWRTTLENILLPLEIVEKHRHRLRQHKAEYVAKAEKLLATVGLKGFGDKYPWQLSGGMQQRANLCRALIHEPELLMLDEPSLGLAPLIVKEIFRIVSELRRTGVAILLIEQNARAALQVADYGYVLETGALVMQGPAAELAANPRVVETYLGLARNAGDR